MTPPPVQVRLEFAWQAARRAGRHALQYYRQASTQVDWKSDTSPVTVADREAEEQLSREVAQAFPDDAFLGEEHGERPGTSGFRWIVDPIDGTKSFISGVPLFGTLIGIEQGGRSVAGVIYLPALDEGIYAAVGGGAWQQRGPGGPHKARVSQKSKLSESLFLTSEVRSFRKHQRIGAYERLEAAAWVSRTWGDAYGYYLVATGQADVMVDPLMNVWDCAALQPVLEEAGGTFTDWSGAPTIHAGEAIATNGLVLEEVLAITREFPRLA